MTVLLSVFRMIRVSSFVFALFERCFVTAVKLDFEAWKARAGSTNCSDAIRRGRKRRKKATCLTHGIADITTSLQVYK